jgi:hypothetical protein
LTASNLLDANNLSLMENLSTASGYILTNMSSDYFKIHSHALFLLDKLPFNTFDVKTKVEAKQGAFKECGPFNVFLPFITSLFKLSPITNLLLSPAVNVRKVTRL